MELELPDFDTTGMPDGWYEKQVKSEMVTNQNMLEMETSGPPPTKTTVKKGGDSHTNPADKSGHPFELDDMPIPNKIAPLVVEDTTLYIYVKRYGADDLMKLKAVDALMHVTGTSFLHLGIQRLKHELTIRELKLSTGLRGQERLQELSSRLERAVIAQRNRKLRKLKRDPISVLRRDLKLVGARVHVIQSLLFDAALLRSDFNHMITLIRRGAASPNFESKDGFTALIRAAFCCDAPATCKLLDSSGIDPDCENLVGENALVWGSCQKGGAAILMELVGISTDVKVPQSRAQTPMVDPNEDGDDVFRVPRGEAAATGVIIAGVATATATATASTVSVSDLRFEKEEKKNKVTLHPGRSYANVNWECATGTTALMAACECGHFDNVAALVELGANINHKTERRGLTSLMIACRHNQEKIATYLLDHGAIVNAKDREGRDAREWSKLCSHHKLANKLESQAWRWKRAEVRKNAGKKLWRKLRIKTKAIKMEAGWSIHVDPSSQVEFYVNKSTGASQWEMPASVLAQRRLTWHTKMDSVTGLPYYWSDAGETTYDMPAILNKHWRSKSRPKSELDRILNKMTLQDVDGKPIPTMEALKDAEDVNNKVLHNLIQRSERRGVVSLPHVGESIDGYRGVRRIVAVSSFLQDDVTTVTKVEWDERVGGVRGRSSALHRSQQATSEYWVEFYKGLLGFSVRPPYPKDPGTTPKGVFVSRVTPGVSQAAEDGRVRVGHWVEFINGEHVRELESSVVAKKMDTAPRPFRIKFKVPMVVCDYCASTFPHTVCVSCDAILCMKCIVASRHSILHPNHRCKTILQIGKDMKLILQDMKTSPKKKKKKNGGGGGGGGGGGSA